jgi:hypothetical protein
LALGVLTLGAGLAVLRPAAAQEQQEVAIVSAAELDEIVGPIALYPDDLVAIVLPASTYPLQVVQAARFLEDQKRDSSLKPDEDWDESIVALLNYPEVVELMNDDLDWTYDLGTAVLNQRADVLNAIQDFRDRAYAAGNLRSDERQTVARNDGEIEIKQADPQVIYVPYYEPERVVVYQTVPVYHYYPRRYPVYYYPYPAHYVFDTGYFWGVRSWFSIGWHSHLVHVYDPFYHSHPYYGWSYYDPWYPRNVFVNINVNRYPNYVWQPRGQRYGGRPVVRGYEGRVYTSDRAPRRGVLDSNAARTRQSATGSTYRATERAAPSSGAATTTREPRRGVPSASYRNRTTETTTRASQEAQASRPTRAAPTGQQRAPSVDRPTQVRPAPTRNGAYRSGGGMAQARERAQAEPSRSLPAPRATQPSTGMPRESSRGFEAQSSPPRAPSGGGMSQAQRGGGDGGGSYRGGDGGSNRSGGNGGGGGGREHPAARGGEGRSAAR